jgi:hypothetical protein
MREDLLRHLRLLIPIVLGLAPIVFLMMRRSSSSRARLSCLETVYGLHSRGG